MMHGREKSDSAIVAGKPTNKAVSTAAERRAEAKGNASQQSTRRTQSRVSVSQALERIRQAVTKNALPSHTQGGSRMPELGPYGSGAARLAAIPAGASPASRGLSWFERTTRDRADRHAKDELINNENPASRLRRPLRP